MAEDVSESQVPAEESGLFFSTILTDILASPLNLFLLSICFILLYKIYKSSREPPPVAAIPTPMISKLKKQDMTLEQLKQYNGTDEDGRTCIAINGQIFDVTKGKKFYGPGGPYAAFAGHDTTRAFATFNVTDVKETYDDLSDLSSMEMDSVKEWEIQIKEKYEYIGKLLKPGEEATEYSDEEEKDKSCKKEE